MIYLLLRKLEAYGFKSFAEKTVIELGPGVTVIVGPNGSGKSNVADAVRWALGEQSMKSLRGSKSEDIIFSGSARRRALGLAEVSLYFDNSDGLLPVDFNEVVITRRIFRSGDSEFFINKSSCRLKDIHDLFADTGVGRDSMMVIGQNKIDEILNAKPEERRLLFEEAAGIIKYKQRKRDALRKIEETELNVTRLLDITNEIETRLGPLQESAARTKDYNKLHDEWLSCKVSQLLRRLTKAEQILQGARSDHEQFSEQEVVFSSQLTIAETEQDKQNTQLADTNQAYHLLSDKLQEIETQLNHNEATVGILGERQVQSNRELERLLADQALLNGKMLENQDKSQSIRAEYEIKLQQQMGRKMQLVSLQQEQTNLETALAKLETKIETGKEHSFDCMQELIAQRNRCSDIEKDLQSITGQKNSHLAEVTVQKQQLAQMEEAYRREAQRLQELSTEQQAEQTSQTSLLTVKQQLTQELSRLEKQENQLQNKLHDTLTRNQILTNMQQDYDGFGKGIKSLLKSKVSWRSSILGAVAELIQVPPNLVTAIEIALGGAAQHLIIDQAQSATVAIEYLKTNHLGRVTFLPLDTVQPLHRRDAEIAAAQENGSLGFANELVKYEAAYKSAIQHILGRTLIVDTLEQALIIAKKYHYSLRLVTIAGELINPGGSLTGGSLQRRENSFIGRQSEIEQLVSEIEAQKQRVTDHEVQLAQARHQLEQVAGKLALCQQTLRENELSQAQLKIHLQQSRQDIRRISQSLQTLATEQQLREQQAVKLDSELLLARQAVSKLEDQNEQQKLAMACWQETSKNQRKQIGVTTEQITELKIALSAIEQNLQALGQNTERYELELLSAQEQLNLLTKQKEEVQKQLDKTATELLSSNELKNSLIAEKVAHEGKLRQLYKQKMAYLSSVAQCDRDSKAIHKKLQEVQTRLHERELLITKYDYEVQSCGEQLMSQFHMTPQEANGYYSDRPIEELLQIIGQLERKMAAIGPINAGAIEEYTQLNERYVFLRQQYNDLFEAQKYLVSIVQEMDDTMAKQFKEAFDKINGYFHELFVRLFGGGQAQLVLLSPAELLDTGIDIIVQPPGKKQQYLSLFSGGERSLTVIALLFSFLSYRPAPFCMVDEIDAALDESNVQRFSEFLKDYAKNTQFIVVTHRKGTMEIADVMHGITMEESGVSKLLSVKFGEIAG